MKLEVEKTTHSTLTNILRFYLTKRIEKHTNRHNILDIIEVQVMYFILFCTQMFLYNKKDKGALLKKDNNFKISI